jgi:ParB-like chromosome segregation protein Spo0J
MKPKLRKVVEIRLENIQLDAQELEVLRKYETNPELQKHVAEMVASLEKEGQLEPICLNENYTKIWRGHTRFLAAKKLGWKTIKAEIMNAEKWQAHMMTEP